MSAHVHRAGDADLDVVRLEGDVAAARVQADGGGRDSDAAVVVELDAGTAAAVGPGLDAVAAGRAAGGRIGPCVGPRGLVGHPDHEPRRLDDPVAVAVDEVVAGRPVGGGTAALGEVLPVRY